MKSFRQVERNLKTLVGKVECQGKREAMRKAARPLVRQAKRNVHKRSGLLKKSIKAVLRTYDGNQEIIVIIGPDRSVKGSKENGQKGWPVKYAHLEEFGTSHSPAHPFLRPAFDAKKNEAISIYTNEVKDAIKRVGKRFNKRSGFA